MTRSIPFAAIAVLVLVTASAFASGPTVGSITQEEEPFSVTARIKGEILELTPDYQLRFRGEDGKERTFLLEESIKLRAQDKKAFDGRKKLRPDDLEVGQRIRVTYRIEPFKIIELKVLKDQKA